MKGINIVIVDKHLIVREGIKILLMDEKNIEIIGEAGNYDELFNCLISLHTDIILLDIDMPTLNGLDMTRRVVSGFPGIKVIMVSVNNNMIYLNMALKAGASGYLTKNTGKNELVEAITMVYQGEKYITKNIDGFIDALPIT